MLIIIGYFSTNAAYGQAHSGERPNILWISAEDMSPRLGAYEDELARTPHLDRLARQGVRYRNAFVPSPTCSPARSSIITGMYPNSIGTHHLRTFSAGAPFPYQAVPPPYVKTFTEYLRTAGYYTTNNSKTDYQFGTPFTAWNESSDQAHWRNRTDPDQPFFAVFNFTTTHQSQVWPRNDEDKALATDPEDVVLPPYYPDTPAVRRTLARHYDNIAQMDGQVGEVLQQLKEDGLVDETIVFFWSDHGDGLPRGKRWLYDAGTRVPLIVRMPEKFQDAFGAGVSGSVSDRLVSLIDLGPSVLSLAGLEVPQHMQGRAFLGPQAKPSRDYVFATRDRVDDTHDMMRAVRDKQYLYIRNYYPQNPTMPWSWYSNNTPIRKELLRLKAGGSLEGPEKLLLRESRPREELYDTKSDPHQIHNLAGDSSYSSVLQRMRSSLNAWMGRIDDLGDVPEYQMALRMWPDSTQPVTQAPNLFASTRAEPLYTADGTLAPGVNGSTYAQPVEIVMRSPTEGASIAYTTEPGEEARWQIYTGPVQLTETTALRAKAIRYGFKSSRETVAEFVITSSE